METRQWVVVAAIASLAACGGGGAIPTGPDGSTDGTGTEGTGSSGGGGGGDGGGGSSPAERLPSSAVIGTVDRQFTPAEVRIRAGGTVTWRVSDGWHEIVFEGAQPPGGDVERLEEGEEVSRTFPEAGTYRFRCDRHDDGGTIHVGSDSTSSETSGGSGGAVVTTLGVTFSPASVTIAAGETVTWQMSGTRHNVTFRGAQPEGGHIPDTDAGRSASRRFVAAGTFAYDCTRHAGMSGRVTVR